MIVHSRIPLWGVIFPVCLALAGCSSSAATKPTKGDAAAGSPPAVSKQEPAKSPPVKESTTGSLQALREGQDPSTSGPLKEIYFDYDKSDLSGTARETLKANASWLKANPAARVEIEGHCDERGTNEYNLALGAKRAQAAKDYLVTLGVPAQRLSTISYGKELPVCRDQTEECWQKNRRDRFVVMGSKPAS